MSYSVKELFYTLQGEGAQTGRAAIFCRFAGCNLWSGREADRATAVCSFCDTDFIGVDGPGGGKFQDAGQLSKAATAIWPAGFSHARPLVVCTGGEPLLQLDVPLLEAFHSAGFEVAVETNGTVLPPPGLDWVCVSPKAGSMLRLTSGDELKLVFPQAGLDPSAFLGMDFRQFWIQPMDGPNLAAHTAQAVEYVLRNPVWRLSLQTHKLLGIP